VHKISKRVMQEAQDLRPKTQDLTLTPDTCRHFVIIARRHMHFEEDDQIPLVSGTGEAFMDLPATPAAGARRNEDIALDLMKFIAMTTGYGKASSPGGGVGFEKSGGGVAKPEEYAAHLLTLYSKCLEVVGKK